MLDLLLSRSIRQKNGCLWYTFGTDVGKGYGQFKGELWGHTAHRASYYLQIGPILPEEHVLHHCDTPRCIEPVCLFLGDCADNMKDAYSKGRHPKQAVFPSDMEYINCRIGMGDSMASIARDMEVDYRSIKRALQNLNGSIITINGGR